MPGTTLSPYTVPAVGDTWPTWGTRVIECLNTLKTDLEAPVLFSEISGTSNLVMNNFQVTDAAAFVCRNGNTSSIPTNGIGIKSGEWYATDSAGNQVQITKNGVVNAATTGGITGSGYGTGGVELKWNSGSSAYEFWLSASAYAPVRMSALKLRNGATAEATISFAGSANISMAMPPDLPAGTSILTMTSGGAIDHDATIGVGFTVNNANMTLTGTADIKHPNRSYVIPAGSVAVLTTGAVNAYSDPSNYVLNSATFQVDFGIAGFKVGDRLQTVVIKGTKSAADTTNFQLFQRNAATGTSSSISTSTANSSSGIFSHTCTVTTPADSTEDLLYWIRATSTSPAGLTTFRHVVPVFNRV